jgi:hypothetical protein
MSKTDFASILTAALAMGEIAGAEAPCEPMVVVSSDGTKAWHVPDGVCGFGWVEFAGNTAFGRWAKANGHARSGYPKGLSIWSKLRTQSMARNEAWAHAVAKCLTANGIPASGRSRID